MRLKWVFVGRGRWTRRRVKKEQENLFRVVNGLLGDYPKVAKALFGESPTDRLE